MTINVTEVIVALIGVLGTIITAVLIPYVKKLVSEQDLALFKKIISTAVQFVEEDLWQNTGNEKREAALNFVNAELSKYKLTFDVDTINAYMSAAVTELVRLKGE